MVVEYIDNMINEYPNTEMFNLLVMSPATFDQLEKECTESGKLKRQTKYFSYAGRKIKVMEAMDDDTIVLGNQLNFAK